MKKVHSVLLLFILFSFSSAWADGSKNTNSWYGKLAAGYVIQIEEYDEVNAGQTAWEFDNGYNGLVSLGREFGSWALEAEISYRKLDADKRRGKISGNLNPLGGDQTQFSGMFNAYYILMPETDISPYFGVGAGATQISWNNVNRIGITPSGIDDSEVVFTYQLIAGVSFDMSERFSMDLDYRYFRPGAPEFTSVTGSVAKFEDQHLHIISAGFKIKF